MAIIVSDLDSAVLLSGCQLSDDLVQFKVVFGVFCLICQVEDPLNFHLPGMCTRLPHLLASFVPMMNMIPSLKEC